MMDINSIVSSLLELPIGIQALTGTAFIISVLLIWEFRSWYRLRHVPGPFWHSLSIYPMNKVAGSGRMSFILKEYGDKYGMRTNTHCDAPYLHSILVIGCSLLCSQVLSSAWARMR